MTWDRYIDLPFDVKALVSWSWPSEWDEVELRCSYWEIHGTFEADYVNLRIFGFEVSFF